MRRLVFALTGVAASAAVGGGAYAFERYMGNQERDQVAQCHEDYEASELRDACVDDVRADYASDGLLNLVQIAGFVGVIACGYQGYRAAFDEADRAPEQSTES